LREFTEETGISAYRDLHNVQNLMPYEEIFTGSNYKSYKHKYYVMFLNPEQYDVPLDQFETSEVSLMAWKTIVRKLTMLGLGRAGYCVLIFENKS
jgi:hypothetical protein